jgi:hypothetical protein
MSWTQFVFAGLSESILGFSPFPDNDFVANMFCCGDGSLFVFLIIYQLGRIYLCERGWRCMNKVALYAKHIYLLLLVAFCEFWSISKNDLTLCIEWMRRRTRGDEKKCSKQQNAWVQSRDARDPSFCLPADCGRGGGSLCAPSKMYTTLAHPPADGHINKEKKTPAMTNSQRATLLLLPAEIPFFYLLFLLIYTSGILTLFFRMQ